MTASIDFGLVIAEMLYGEEIAKMTEIDVAITSSLSVNQGGWGVTASTKSRKALTTVTSASLLPYLD